MPDLKEVKTNLDTNKNKFLSGDLSENEAFEVSRIIEKFVKSYTNKDKNLSDEQWLNKELKLELPEKTEEEIRQMADEILESVDEFDKNYRELNQECNRGLTSNTWLMNKITEASTGISVIEFGNYLNAIDNSITIANAQMMRTITTNAGEISQCMNLDGFIAEQHAVNTFNMQAQLEKSPYYAEVLVPSAGETYGLNSFDTVISPANKCQ